MSANMNALRIKSRSAIALILVALLALDTAVNPVLSRRCGEIIEPSIDIDPVCA